MAKSYCTQNNGDCATCTLVNYGFDCANNPLPTNPRKGTKESRAMAAYGGFTGRQTVAHIKKLIGKELEDQLTGRQFGLVMSAVSRAYHEGRASTGAEMVDSNCVWINSLNRAIEWEEIGAEYGIEDFTETIDGRTHAGKRTIKLKDGQLVCRFSGREKAD
jgi:hypothetical protein